MHESSKPLSPTPEELQRLEKALRDAMANSPLSQADDEPIPTEVDENDADDLMQKGVQKLQQYDHLDEK